METVVVVAIVGLAAGWLFARLRGRACDPGGCGGCDRRCGGPR